MNNDKNKIMCLISKTLEQKNKIKKVAIATLYSNFFCSEVYASMLLSINVE